MFYRHINYQETEVHQCADIDKYTQEHKREIAHVQRHDVHTYFNVGEKNIYIKYCPYCGINLNTDESTNEYLKLKF